MKKLTFIYLFVVFVAVFFSANAFADFYVIAVQNKCGPCKGTRSAEGRWCDNGDGTVTDMTTCLVWLKYADWGGGYGYSFWVDTASGTNAHDRAGILGSGETIHESSGYVPVYLTDGSVQGDWRLPTKTELSGIINEGGETVCYSNMQLFEGLSESHNAYWSSTTYAPVDGYAWYVTMIDGFVGGGTKGNNYWAWPVRSDN